MPTISQEKKQILNRSLGVSKRLSDALDKTEAKVGKLITKASRDPKISQQAIRRTSLFDKVLEEYSKTAREMAEELGIELEEQNKSSAKATAKKIPNAKPHKLSEDQKVTALDGKNVSQLVAVSTGNMSANAIAKLRKAVVKVMNEKALEGLTADEVQKRLQEEWDKLARNKKGFRFVDARGVAWENSRYLQMLVRTTMSTIARNAEINTLVKNGRDIAMISEDGGGDGDCEVCARWEGKMVSLTGATKGFPTLADAQSDGLFHPNCVHRIEYVDDDEIEDYMKKHGIKKPRKKKATTSKKPSTSKKTGTKKTKTTTEETTTKPKRTRKSKVSDGLLQSTSNGSYKGNFANTSSNRLLRSNVSNNANQDKKKYIDSIRRKSSHVPEDTFNKLSRLSKGFLKLANDCISRLLYVTTMSTSQCIGGTIYMSALSEWMRHPFTALHEIGHAIFNKKRAMLNSVIFDHAKRESEKILKTLEEMGVNLSKQYDDEIVEVNERRKELAKLVYKNKDYRKLSLEAQLINGLIGDIIQASTKGKFNAGHKRTYYNESLYQTEIIANLVALSQIKNSPLKKLFPETYEDIKKFILDVQASIAD